VWALSALQSHSHYWLCYLGNTRVTATQFWCRSVLSSVIQSGFILQSFILIHISLFFCPLSFIPRSKSSLWTPYYQAYQDLFNFDGGGNRSAQRKPPVRDPRRKSLLHGATYLVPRAGIEPTSRTDIGYRPVSQTRGGCSSTTHPGCNGTIVPWVRRPIVGPHACPETISRNVACIHPHFRGTHPTKLPPGMYHIPRISLWGRSASVCRVGLDGNTG
jgi:hypothetical protein